jgi:hypothetical protein
MIDADELRIVRNYTPGPGPLAELSLKLSEKSLIPRVRTDMPDIGNSFLLDFFNLDAEALAEKEFANGLVKIIGHDLRAISEGLIEQVKL